MAAQRMKTCLWQKVQLTIATINNLGTRYENFHSLIQGAKLAIYIIVCRYALHYAAQRKIFRDPVFLLELKLALYLFTPLFRVKLKPLYEDLKVWSLHDAPHPPSVITINTLLKVLPFLLPSTFALFGVLESIKRLWPYLLSFCFAWPVYMMYVSFLYDFTGLGRCARNLWIWFIKQPTGVLGLLSLTRALTYLGEAMNLSTSYPVCNAVCILWPSLFSRCAANLSLASALVIATIPMLIGWLFRNDLRIFYWYVEYSFRYAMNTKYIAPGKLHNTKHVYTLVADGYFRVLDILPGDPASEGGIYTKLRHVRLGTVPYDAISYTWGNSAKARGIFVDGSWMPITENAFEVIQDRVPRVKTKINTIWIDCICIDQENNVEKSHQVRIMDKIYQQANRTIVWLGNTYKAIHAITLIHEIARRIPMQSSLEVGSEDGFRLGITFRTYLYLMSDCRDIRFQALAEMLQHPYFSRVWIIQEISNSKTLHIRYGKCWLDWSLFDHVVRLFLEKRFAKMIGTEVLQMHTPKLGVITQIQFLSRCRAREQAYHLTRDERPNLEQILNDAALAEATDERDLVFGILNLSADAKSSDLAPDYSIDSAELFRRVATYFLKKARVHEILYTSGIGYHRKIKALPSWMPDWSCRSTVNRLRVKGVRTYDSSLDHHQCVPETKSGLLAMKGLRVDRISSITTTPFPSSDLKIASPMSQMLSRLEHAFVQLEARKCVQSLPITYEWTKQPRDEVFTRTLIGDQSLKSLSSTPDPWSSGTPANCNSTKSQFERPAAIDKWAQLTKSRNQVLSRWDKLGLPDTYQTLPDDQKLVILTHIHPQDWVEFFLDEISDLGAQVSIGRKFAVTEKGYMALVPPLSEVGDDICVLFGLDVPFVLRQCLDVGTLKYQVVGESYVHGIMDGEACLGGMQGEELDFLIE